MPDNTTIIIPTHHRHSHLERALEMYADYDNTSIVVADSTDVPFNGDIPANVLYLHRPDLGFIEKLTFAMNQCETPFLCMRADNRHTLMRGIREAEAHLEQHPHCAVAHGAYVAVERIGDQLEARPNYEADQFLGITGTTPSQRIKAVWQGYVPTFYGVVRSELWRSALQDVAGKLTNFNALEVHTALHFAMHGTVARLPVLHNATVITQRVSGKTATYDDFRLVATEERYGEEFSLLRDSAASHLARLEGLAKTEARARVDASLAACLAANCPLKRPKTLARRLTAPIRSLKKRWSNRPTARRAAFRAGLDRQTAALDAQSKKELTELMRWLREWA